MNTTYKLESIFSTPPLRESDGVLSYSHEDFYWEMKVPREKIRACNVLMKEGMLFANVTTQFALDPVYTTALNRSDFIFTIPFHIPADRPLRILDLGSGYGNITLQIAKRFPNAIIVAADASLDILQFLSYRLRDEKITNVTCVHISPIEKNQLPFTKDCFDLIVLNGVLEWIGAGVSSGDPHKYQVSALTQLRTLLSPEGVMYVGIENRNFFGYYAGVRDPHSGLRFTSFLPRNLANRLSLYLRRMPYRTYIYGHRGYSRLFKEAGFKHDAIHSSFVWASYKDPYTILPIIPNPTFRSTLRRFSKNIFPTWRSRCLYVFLGFFRLDVFFAPSFLLYVTRNGFTDNHKSLAERYFLEATGIQPTRVIQLPGSIRDDGSAYFFITHNAREWNMKIPRIQRGLPMFMPTTWVHGAYNGSTYYVYPFVPGVSLSSLSKSVMDVKVFKFIKDFHQSCRGTHSDNHQMSVRHGDLTPENIIVSEEGIYHLIDFDDSEITDNQIYDLCDYLIHVARIIKKHNPLNAYSFLTSEEIIEIMNEYDKSITITLWNRAMKAYLEMKISTISATRKEYLGYLQNLLVLYSSKS